ncbi:unnamed protein product, partial [Ectocarpus sp. 12 AP-2014]
RVFSRIGRVNAGHPLRQGLVLPRVFAARPCCCRPSVRARSLSVARLRGSAASSPAISSSKISFCCCRQSVRARSRSVVAGHRLELAFVLWRLFAARPCRCRQLVQASCGSIARLVAHR